MAEWGEEEFECEWPDENPDDQDMQGPEVELQNTFYTAEDMKRAKPAEALDMFENVILLAEQVEGEAKFKFQALQNIVVLSAQLGQLGNMVDKQKMLLRMVNKVSREDLSEAVNAILYAVTNYLADKP